MRLCCPPPCPAWHTELQVSPVTVALRSGQGVLWSCTDLLNPAATCLSKKQSPDVLIQPLLPVPFCIYQEEESKLLKDEILWLVCACQKHPRPTVQFKNAPPSLCPATHATAERLCQRINRIQTSSTGAALNAAFPSTY